MSKVYKGKSFFLVLTNVITNFCWVKKNSNKKNYLIDQY